MGYDEKVDVIDLIINVLRDHEKTLDGLISKLEQVLAGSAPVSIPAVKAEVVRPAVSVIIREWTGFRERCLEADIVTFEIEDRQFKVSAVKDGILYLYEEEIPEMEIRYKEEEKKAIIEGIDIRSTELVPTVLRGRLLCGLNISVKGTEVKMPDAVAVYKILYDIDVEEAKSWLAKQLKTDKKNIIRGKIQI
jgi:hypothetical protein